MTNDYKSEARKNKPAQGQEAKPSPPLSNPASAVPPVDDFPASTRVWKADGAIRVPFRRIAQGGDQPAIDVYDTFGPRDVDLRQGLPKLRKSWIDRREARGDGNVSQMHYARGGEITEEMRYVALRESVTP